MSLYIPFITDDGYHLGMMKNSLFYDFDASDAGPTDPGSVWTSDANAFDKDLETEAGCSTSGSSSSNYLEGQGTDAPGSGSTINSVKFRVTASYTSSASTLGLRITTDAAAETLLDTTQALTTVDTEYTFTLTAPSGGWTWAKIQALEVRYWRESGLGTVKVLRGEAEVLYDTPADADWDNQDNVILLAGQSKVKSLWSYEAPIANEGYGFDASDSGPTDPGDVWSNDANAFDGDFSTNSQNSASGSSASNYLEGQGTSAPGSGGTIGSVELVVHVSRTSTGVLGVRVTTDAAAETLLDTTQALTSTPTSYTFSLSTPSGGWTYAKLQALEIRYWKDSGSDNISIFGGLAKVITGEADPVIHVATQQENGRVAYHVFDPGTDAWTIRDEQAVPLDLTPSTNPACSIALRSDGDVIITYNDGANIDYARREGSIWNTNNEIIALAGNGVVVGPDSSDRITIIYRVNAGTLIGTKSLSSTNALSGSTTVDPLRDNATFVIGPGVIDSANLITIPYIDASNDISTAQWTSAAAPTPINIKADVSDQNVLGHGAYTVQEQTSGTESSSVFGASGANEKQAQSFKVDRAVEIISLTLLIGKSSSPTDNLEVSIQTDSSGDPSGTKLTTKVISAASIPTANTVVRFDFDPVFLETGVLYWIVAERSGSRDITNTVELKHSTTGSYSDGNRKHLDSASWVDESSHDINFSIDDVTEIGPVACLALDGTDVHLIYSDDDVTTPTYDLFHDDDASVAGGGTETEVEDAVTAIRVSCNVVP